MTENLKLLIDKKMEKFNGFFKLSQKILKPKKHEESIENKGLFKFAIQLNSNLRSARSNSPKSNNDIGEEKNEPNKSTTKLNLKLNQKKSRDDLLPQKQISMNLNLVLNSKIKIPDKNKFNLKSSRNLGISKIQEKKYISQTSERSSQNSPNKTQPKLDSHPIYVKDAVKNRKIINQKLLNASEAGDIKEINRLLSLSGILKPDINCANNDKWTALHYASSENQLEVLRVLILSGCNKEAKTSFKRTALHIACIRGFYNIVKELLHYGADTNAIDIDLNTPLHFAFMNDYSNIVQLLIETKPDLEIKNKIGYYSFELAQSIDTLNTISKYMNYKKYYKLRELFNSKKNRLITEKEGKIQKGPNANNPGYLNSRKLKVIKIEVIFIKEVDKDSINNNSIKNIDMDSKISTNVSSKLQSNIEVKLKMTPNDFIAYELIGKGSFGEVYAVLKKDNNKFYAMKVLSKSKIIGQNLIKYAKAERNVISYVRHPFIVGLSYAFQTPDKLVLILDYCPGGDLGHILEQDKRFSEDRARIYIAELVTAIEDLHKRDIIYRDLKPDNVVLDAQGHALLTDFGLSKEGIYDNVSAKSFCGSVAYLAPEMVLKTGHGKSVDWYLLGVLFYEMLVGIPPYFNENKDLLFENIISGPLKMPSKLSMEAKNLIVSLLNRNPNKRLGSGKEDANEVKKHPFFNDLNWDEVLERKLQPPKPEIKPLVMSGITISQIFNVKHIPLTKNFIPGWSFIQNNNQQI